MKREEKSALSKQKILEAAMEEFSRKGYSGASLNTVWAEKGISKGIIYHHFQDKDELYLLCVRTCFDAITAYLQTAADSLSGTSHDRLKNYFDARFRFFTDHPVYLGIFIDASVNPPEKLLPRIRQLRQDFDQLNISVLKKLLRNEPLRPGLSADLVADDFRMYMDYFNMHFRVACCENYSQENHSQNDILRKHEEMCHRQLDILLHGVLDSDHGRH